VKIYRVAKKNFIQDLSGEGARLYGGRWNKKGDAMVYFSEHLSLCVLEVLAHMNYQFFTKDFFYIEAEISEKSITSIIKPKTITENWRMNPPISTTQEYGSNWLSSNLGLALAVPSAVLPTERNILINPTHKLISKLKIITSDSLDLDSRMIK